MLGEINLIYFTESTAVEGEAVDGGSVVTAVAVVSPIERGFPELQIKHFYAM